MGCRRTGARRSVSEVPEIGQRVARVWIAAPATIETYLQRHPTVSRACGHFRSGRRVDGTRVSYAVHLAATVVVCRVVEGLARAVSRESQVDGTPYLQSGRELGHCKAA